MVEICHGTWSLPAGRDFNNYGRFVLWIETSTPSARKSAAAAHPASLARSADVRDFLKSVLHIPEKALLSARVGDARFSAVLPSEGGRPLPSVEMAHRTGELLPASPSWGRWRIHGIEIGKPLQLLRDLNYALSIGSVGVSVGHDLQFWIGYAQQLRNLVKQHQFLPVLRCRQKSVKRKVHYDLSPGWVPAAQQYEWGLQAFAAAMPTACAAVDGPDHGAAPVNPEFQDPRGLLQHFSEQQVESLIAETAFPVSFLKPLKDSWFVVALGGTPAGPHPKTTPPDTEEWQQWKVWYDRIVGRAHDSGFVLGVRLSEARKNGASGWRLSFFVSAVRDPSLQIDLEEWWGWSAARKARWLKELGDQFERHLLVGLGHAARMCPLLWQGMESEQPTGLDIGLETAYDFLKNDSLVLDSAGFKVVLPSWWTPLGRRRARIRIKASGKSADGATSAKSTGFMDLDHLVKYRYELSIDGETVSEREWRSLVGAKRGLVQFRGEWMEIDPGQMSQMLDLWRQKDAGVDDLHIGQLMKDMAESDEDTVEFQLDDVLSATLRGLQNQDDVSPAENPPGLQGELRSYQKTGLAWLAMQESLGLNPCLADDMGLGKTVQLLALLLRERQAPPKGSRLKPTLLVAPTSVLSNWQKEVEKFAPQLNCVIHHGADRPRSEMEFQPAIAGADLVVTSFALARRDKDVLRAAEWGRVIVDEAQNIKNPKSAQAKAIFSFQAPHRIAVTGTPVENRLMDLWSLFNFLNPGYLGTMTQFRRAYETPIQHDSDPIRGRQLQRLVQPFILRRLKTDKTIINDLPDKVEQKVFCSLTREQASLYQAVVDDVQEKIAAAEAMERRGLILATLMKLKQICNHPAQFLQDGSAFDETRSHKLTRLNEMVDEALAENDSLLIFTQFTEVGHELELLLRSRHDCPVHYLHGGTSRRRRENMIEGFQDADAPASVFVLSLRAGGVGITLTRANHVFHFDRWWNPAVEDQATDRAYRIGQKKTVFAHKMVALGTLEERIDAMIESKQALAENIVGTGEDWLTEMDDDAFRNLIALNRQTIMEA